jgi:uncharacterized damage-inducible protein DinB
MTIASTGSVSVLRLNTRLFLNCLLDLSEEHARQRPNERTNSIIFIACHLIESRHTIAHYLLIETANPLDRYIKDAVRIEDVTALPSLPEVRYAWGTISMTLDECLSELTEPELKAPSPQRFPVDLPTVLGGIGFLLEHESYHIGQLALLRKFHGYPAMTYR